MAASSTLEARLGAASRGERFFYFLRNESVPTVHWQEEWARKPDLSSSSRIHVAHCVVGQPRSILAPEVRKALVGNLFNQFPGSQRVFVQFSIPAIKNQNTQQRDVTRVTAALHEALQAAARDLGAVSINVTDDVRNGLEDCHARKASLPDGDPEHARLYSIVAWENVRRCFHEQVQSYEKKRSLAFDFVTRIRPDAVHFAPIILPPVRVMHYHVVLPFRGVDGAGYLPNDHQAVVPRNQASMYFEEIARRFNDCSANGTAFHDHWHLKEFEAHAKGSTRVRSIEASAAFRLKYMGHKFVEIPWPYALSARMCCCNPSCNAQLSTGTCWMWYGREHGSDPGLSGRHPAGSIRCLAERKVPQTCSIEKCPLRNSSSSIESAASACVLPLQCSRLSPKFNEMGIRGLPPNNTLPLVLEHHLHACANASRWAEQMQGPCATPDLRPWQVWRSLHEEHARRAIA